MKRKFIELPYGTRFRFWPHGSRNKASKSVYVVTGRLGRGQCAKWEGTKANAQEQEVFAVVEKDQQIKDLEVWVYAEDNNTLTTTETNKA